MNKRTCKKQMDIFGKTDNISIVINRYSTINRSQQLFKHNTLLPINREGDG